MTQVKGGEGKVWKTYHLKTKLPILCSSGGGGVSLRIGVRDEAGGV
jgi:hypothetical protein